TVRGHWRRFPASCEGRCYLSFLAGSWNDGFSDPISVIFLNALPIADPILGISCSIFLAALFNPRPRSSTVTPLLSSVFPLPAEVDESAAAAWVKPKANSAAMMTFQCMRHLAVSETSDSNDFLFRKLGSSTASIHLLADQFLGF